MALAVSQCFHMVGQTVAGDATLMPQDTARVVLPWPENVKAGLDSLVADPLMERTQLGLMVYDLSADSTLYRYGSRQTLRPASTMKLLTGITALDVLGSRYDYRTYLYYTGTIANGVLSGDIWLVGGMDPLFDDTDMHIMAETLHRVGVDSISGRIVRDVSFKEEMLLGEGWCWDDDNPQLTPLLVSRKDEFADRFKDELVKCGVAVNAPITSDRLPKDALLICSRSHRLSEVLEPMMKESDNLFAESMFFQIAASMGKRPATAAHARQIIKSTVAKAGVTGVPYRIADGSGLSLYNYVTPELMVSLLRYAYLKRCALSLTARRWCRRYAEEAHEGWGSPGQRPCQDGHRIGCVVVGRLLSCRQSTPPGLLHHQPRNHEECRGTRFPGQGLRTALSPAVRLLN